MKDGERFIEAVREHAPSPRVLVDVGAHRGKDAIAFKAAFPGSLVLAVDPLNLDIEACLVAGVVPVVAACSGGFGPRQLFLDGNDSLASVYGRGLDPKGEITVAAIPLDSFSPHPDAIKIDAEGAAWDVLRGASQRALSHARVVQIETETEAFFAGQHLEDECFFLLEGFGFKKIWEERHAITATGQQTESIWVRP